VTFSRESLLRLCHNGVPFVDKGQNEQVPLTIRPV